MADAQGRGYAGLLAHDLARHAMLMEALGPPMSRLDLPVERMIAALGQTLRQAWSLSRPADLVVDPAQEKARGLGEMVRSLWEELGRPCSAAVADQAMLFSERRAAAFDLDRCVVVHGDPHPGNALRVLEPRPGAESGFVFVDPDGFLADPTYDLGVVLRDWCPQLLAGDAASLARRYCRLLATETGADATAVWEWGSSNGCPQASSRCSLELRTWAYRSSPPPSGSPAGGEAEPGQAHLSSAGPEAAAGDHTAAAAVTTRLLAPPVTSTS
jgi:streptomycin 6-kinase